MIVVRELLLSHSIGVFKSDYLNIKHGIFQGDSYKVRSVSKSKRRAAMSNCQIVGPNRRVVMSNRRVELASRNIERSGRMVGSDCRFTMPVHTTGLSENRILKIVL